MYVGHTSEDGRVQPLAEHLNGVADRCGELAHLIGLWSLLFQITI